MCNYLYRGNQSIIHLFTPLRTRNKLKGEGVGGKEGGYGDIGLKEKGKKEGGYWEIV